ncbi:IS701 family transposase [candidate division KSB1 bacterium]|nr:IS701 family transposase [candidate division KSB1 bacterium]
MFRITDYPVVVKDHLDQFKDLFSKPQLSHFAEYLTGLIVCDRANIKQINNSFVGHREYSNKDRFMTRARWPEEKVDRRRIELIKSRIGHLNPVKGCLGIDDTILEKFGKQIEEAGKYYDHAEARYVWGHNIVTSQYVTPRGCFPIGLRLYLKRDKKDKAFRTKIELAQELVEHALLSGLRFKTVVFDAWFLSKDFVKFIESRELNWVGAAKSDRIIFPGGQRMNLETFRCTLKKSDFKKIDIDGKTFYCFTKTVKMSKLGKVRLLIVHEEEDLSDTPKYLVTNNLRWEARRILKVYQGRWPIETFYRNSKQNLALEDYEMRDLVGIKRHWYLVFLSYTLLTLSSMDRSLRIWVNANVRTIGEKCRWAASEIIRDFTLWVLKQNSLKRSANEILTIVFAPRSKIGQRFQIA